MAKEVKHYECCEHCMHAPGWGQLHMDPCPKPGCKAGRVTIERSN